MNESEIRPAHDVKPGTLSDKGPEGNPFAVEPTARRQMLLEIVVDNSGSMNGQKIAAVNEVMKDISQFVGDFSVSNPDAEIKMNVLIFSDGARWMYPDPVSADQFKWVDLTAGGGTDFAAASVELERRFHRSADMGNPAGNYAPSVILLTDGEFNYGWEEMFDKTLLRNKWYGIALKRAVAIGNDAVTESLAKVTGSIERVITVHNLEALKEVLRLTTKGISTIGSTSALTGSGSKDDQLTAAIKDGVDDVDGANMASDPVAHIEDEWD